MIEDRPRARSDEKHRKREHILKSRDFMAVYKKGLRTRAGALVLGCLPNGLAHNRLGFSISSRNVALAVDRNRLKRLFREVYRKRKGSLRKSFDLVLIFRSNPPKKFSYPDAEALFMKAARGAGVVL